MRWQKGRRTEGREVKSATRGATEDAAVEEGAAVAVGMDGTGISIWKHKTKKLLKPSLWKKGAREEVSCW
jgi:hypothetical protein